MQLRIKHINVIISLLLVAALFARCGKDSPSPAGGVGKATISIATMGIVANHAGDPDIAITSLRVMIFRSGMHIRYNEAIDLTNGNPFTLTIDQGEYDFVFIANEDSDTEPRADAGNRTLSNILDSYSGNVSGMYDQYFTSASFRNEYSIPMTKIIRNVRVTEGNKVYVGTDESPQPSPWPVEVERAGIRVDVFMETSYLSMKNGFTNFEVLNVPDKVYFFENDMDDQVIYNVTGTSDFESMSPVASYRAFPYNKGDLYSAKTPEFTGDADYSLTATDAEVGFVPIGNKWYWYKRLILPSTVFETKGTNNLGIQLQVTANERIYSLTLSDQAETDFTVTRNSRYRLNGNLKPDYIEFTVGVNAWGDNTDVDIPLILP